MSKSIKGICIIKELGNIIPRNYLIAIYKSFVRLHFVYGNLIFDQSNNEHFSQQAESIPYNASLAITSVIKGLSRFKLYNEKYFHSVLLSLDDDSENFVPFTKLEVLVYLDACFTLFQRAVKCIIPAHYQILSIIIQHFSCLLYQNVIN